jgi:hypothetical protein
VHVYHSIDRLSTLYIILRYSVYSRLDFGGENQLAQNFNRLCKNYARGTA